MNIPLKMNKDFEKAILAVNEKYGEDFDFLNGFHETQLNFSDFIDSFVDHNVADVTIDAKQIGYVRHNDNILMEDLTDEELEALYDYLQELRNGTDNAEND